MAIKHMQHRSGGASRDRSTTGRLTKGLGWFSIGLGLAEVVAPGAVAALIGVPNDTKQRTLLRIYGLRELGAGVGILIQPRPAGWLWARVAGDAVDLWSLASAMGSRRNGRARLSMAIVSVAGVTAADVYCAQELSGGLPGMQPGPARLVRTIIVDRPAEEAYRFWHDFQNLPKFMTYLDSVRYTADRRTHWVANGPGGARIEWDAEIVLDDPNRMIAWRSVEGSTFEHSGSVRFERAPGDRGTLVRVEMDYSATRTAAALGKILQMDIGQRIAHDLRNFKQMLEIGEVTQSDASIHTGMHPARPDAVEQEPVYQH